YNSTNVPIRNYSDLLNMRYNDPGKHGELLLAMLNGMNGKRASTALFFLPYSILTNHLKGYAFSAKM
ncbi:MAG: hypothetical protein K8I82_08715, partial [Anaerolineae bacterium]|nr:hypothetical protein [Anaerolineae bacterium]